MFFLVRILYFSAISNNVKKYVSDLVILELESSCRRTGVLVSVKSLKDLIVQDD